jgi:lysozyme family protein
MPSSFDLAIPFILRHEGGFANNVNDPGGATNFGISLRWLKAQGHEVGDFTHPGEPDYSVADIRAMTQEQAVKIYRECWWDKFGFSNFEAQPLATKMFDGAVNMGVCQVVKLLQRALGRIGYGLVVDGKLGPNTFDAANRSAAADLHGTVTMLANQEHQFYQSLATAHAPKFDEFLKGWLRRADELYL